MPTIVIAGCGFGGASVALSLARRLGKKAKIVAIDRTSSFDYHATLPELASGKVEEKDITVPYADLFRGKPIKFVRDEIKSIDRKSSTVSCSKSKFKYDYLVLSLGSETNFFNIKGAKENSMQLKSFSGANLIREKALGLCMRKKSFSVSIVGGGLSGIELACEMADLQKRQECAGCKIKITVIDRSSHLHASLSEEAGRHMEARMRAIGISLIQGAQAEAVFPNIIALSGGKKIMSDMTIWCAGIMPPSVVENIAGDSYDTRCGMVLNQYLQCIGDGHIYCLGDCGWCSAFEGKPILTALRAIEQSDWVSHNLYCDIAGKPLSKLPYNPRRFPTFVSLGGGYGLLDFNGMWMAGPHAYWLKKLGEKIHMARFRHRLEFLELADEIFLSFIEFIFWFKLWGK